jgi:hypothetical protein
VAALAGACRPRRSHPHRRRHELAAQCRAVARRLLLDWPAANADGPQASGLLLGQRALALGTPALASASGIGLTVSRNSRLATSPAESHEAWSAVPYVGIGYSGLSSSRGWGFTADVGLAGTAGGLRTRRDGALGTQGVDELLRELRLTPVLQFGASYAF